MNTPRADYKLREAKFFLDHLKTENKKSVRNDPEAFKYYLSAFLNAAYSVKQVLPTETHIKGERFNGWCKEWRQNLSSNDKKLIDFFEAPETGQRGMEVHKLGAETLRKEKAVRAESLPGFEVFGPPAFFYGEANVQAAREAGVPGAQAWVYMQETVFKRDGEPPVIQTCEGYVVLLERLLHDFQKSYSVTTP